MHDLWACGGLAREHGAQGRAGTLMVWETRGWYYAWLGVGDTIEWGW